MTTTTAAGTNWAGNHTYRAARLHHPRDVDELAGIIAAASSVHVLGTGHCFNDIADTDGELVSLTEWPEQIDIDAAAATVSISGAVTYGRLAPVLHAAGWALANLASLPHVSVAGAVVTGTHGSGSANGSLATSVAALDIFTGEGEVLELDRDTAAFRGAVVNLGAFGAITRLVLDLVPTYQIRQDAFDGVAFDEVLAHLDEVLDMAYSVSVFTDFAAGAVRVLVKSRSDVEPVVLGVPAATAELGPNWTAGRGVSGPWSERLAHFRFDAVPSVGAELQSEYLVDRQHAVAVLDALRSLGPRIAPLLYASEIRTVAGSNLWLDPAYGRDTLSVGFTWRPDESAVLAVLPLVEAVLAPFDPRPHWGKLFVTSAAELADRYPKLADFRWMAGYFDPRGVFRNDFLRRTVWGASG